MLFDPAIPFPLGTHLNACRDWHQGCSSQCDDDGGDRSSLALAYGLCVYQLGLSSWQIYQVSVIFVATLQMRKQTSSH